MCGLPGESWAGREGDGSGIMAWGGTGVNAHDSALTRALTYAFPVPSRPVPPPLMTPAPPAPAPPTPEQPRHR